MVRVEAVSKAGYSTALLVEVGREKLQFDCGSLFAESAKHVFLTHCHLDHCAAVFLLLRQRGMAGLATHIYLPQSSFEVFERAREALKALDNHESQENKKDLVTVLGVEAGQVVEVSKSVRVIACASKHRVPSVGYVVQLIEKKLKAEYQDLSGEEKAALFREKLIEPYDMVERTVFAYTGDTLAESLREDALYLAAETLAVEVTFVEPLDGRVSVASARTKGHVHLAEIRDLCLMGCFANVKRLLLLHFSARYSVNRMAKAFMEVVPRDVLERIEPVWTDFGVDKEMADSFWCCNKLFSHLLRSALWSDRNVALWNVKLAVEMELLDGAGVRVPCLLVKPTKLVESTSLLLWIGLKALEDHQNRVCLVTVPLAFESEMKQAFPQGNVSLGDNERSGHNELSGAPALALWRKSSEEKSYALLTHAKCLEVEAIDVRVAILSLCL